MQCENGYIKDGVNGILCRKAEEPKSGDLKATAHALCGHQRFCPNQRCYTMLPGWEKCLKRGKTDCRASAAALARNDKAGEKPAEAAGEEIAAKTGKAKAKKKSAQSASETP